MNLKFSDLTEEEVELITNGCGNKKGVIRAPSFIFLASCNHHDFNYKLGYREKDRKRADEQFYAAMKVDFKRYSGYKRVWFKIWALMYFISVRSFGSWFFNYLDHRLTREELDVMLEKVRNE